MAAFNLFIAISGVVFAFFVLGIHNYLTAHEENSCEMTYMFEYPQYVVSFCAGNYIRVPSFPFSCYLHARSPILLSIIKSKTFYFQKIALSENDTVDFPKYALYAYGEGQYTEKLRNMQFNGIPVLFVPGNSGSYKQGLDRI